MVKAARGQARPRGLSVGSLKFDLAQLECVLENAGGRDANAQDVLVGGKVLFGVDSFQRLHKTATSKRPGGRR